MRRRRAPTPGDDPEKAIRFRRGCRGDIEPGVGINRRSEARNDCQLTMMDECMRANMPILNDCKGELMADRSSDRPILLGGEHVGLALMVREDVSKIAHWHQDLEFTANIGGPGEAHSLEMRQEAFERNARPRPDSIEFAVILLATGQLVGFGGLFDISRAMAANLFVGIGARDSWNKGVGTEATRLLCEYGFFFRNLHNIKVEVNGYNRRAIRLYERIGFKPVGRLRGVILMNGKRYDQVIMDLLSDEFEMKHVAGFKTLEMPAGT